VGEPTSHTRNAYALLRYKYAEPGDFVCPGHATGVCVGRAEDEGRERLDFSCRENISYSFRVLCEKSDRRLAGVSGPIMVDMGPVFKRLSSGPNGGPVDLNDELLRSLSPNHVRRGQNILSTDGSVQFMRARMLGQDDIFTIEKVTRYYGHEAPRDPLDAFFP